MRFVPHHGPVCPLRPVCCLRCATYRKSGVRSARILSAVGVLLALGGAMTEKKVYSSGVAKRGGRDATTRERTR